VSGTVAFFVLLFRSDMPDVSGTPWREVARGVAPGDEGAHERSSPYFILATNETELTAVMAMKRRLTSTGWRVSQDPDALGGVSLDRGDDRAKVLTFDPFPGITTEDLADYSVAPGQLRAWQGKYAHVYVLELLSP
jgi:hypothetical protein